MTIWSCDRDKLLRKGFLSKIKTTLKIFFSLGRHHQNHIRNQQRNLQKNLPKSPQINQLVLNRWRWLIYDNTIFDQSCEYDLSSIKSRNSFAFLRNFITLHLCIYVVLIFYTLSLEDHRILHSNYTENNF